MNYQLITTNAQLEEVCRRVQDKKALALDTEFIRTRTYYPQVGLIQLFDGEQAVLIDPLTITQWQPFITLLNDVSVVKFLHAGGEDLELFFHQFSVLPNPLLDTQILAAFLGHPLSWGFAAMVNYHKQITLDKSEVRTNWLARPLTEKQCRYAAADVVHLLPIAHELVAQCKAANLLSAAQNECQLMCARRSTRLPVTQAWRDITLHGQLNARQFTALTRLAAWRLTVARSQDIAVNFVVREEHLVNLARQLPDSLGQLIKVGLDGREVRVYGEQIVAIITEVAALTEGQLMQPPASLTSHADYQAMYHAIKAVVKQVSDQSGLSVELLASRRQINQLLNYHWRLSSTDTLPDLLNGWRGQLMQTKIIDVLHQRSSQAVAN